MHSYLTFARYRSRFAGASVRRASVKRTTNTSMLFANEQRSVGRLIRSKCELCETPFCIRWQLIENLIYSKASKLPQIQRLLELLRRKRQLEDTIHVSMGDLEKSFKLAADQLSLCIRART